MKGILFKEPLFHKVISRKKKQTRRFVKDQQEAKRLRDIYYRNEYYEGYSLLNTPYFIDRNSSYKVGDTVFLREPYRIINQLANIISIELGYSKIRISIDILKTKSAEEAAEWINKRYEEQKKSKTGYCNKMFMPEFLAINFIRITNVSCDRLQDISDDDCFKEGIYTDHVRPTISNITTIKAEDTIAMNTKKEERLIKEVIKNREDFGFEGMSNKWIREELDTYSCDDCSDEIKNCDICGATSTCLKTPISDEEFFDARDAFSFLIDSISSKGTWGSNPFVFVYDFEIIGIEEL